MTAVALAVLRVWIGLVVLVHGANHARSIEGTTRWFGSKGYRHPRFVAWGSAVGEIAIGLGMIAGLLTPLAAAGVVVVAINAFWSVHRFAGFFVFRRPDEGWEYVATLAVGAAVIAVSGPGEPSLDTLLGWDRTLSGSVGLWIVLAGAVLAVAQLAWLWRAPDRSG